MPMIVFFHSATQQCLSGNIVKNLASWPRLSSNVEGAIL
jgi:hypothetical protein